MKQEQDEILTGLTQGGQAKKPSRTTIRHSGKLFCDTVVK